LDNTDLVQPKIEFGLITNDGSGSHFWARPNNETPVYILANLGISFKAKFELSVYVKGSVFKHFFVKISLATIYY